VASPKPGTPTPSGKPSPTPPPVPAPKAVPAELHAALQQETVELLGLLARQSYDRVVDNYVQPDAAEFARTERVLDDIVQGSASKGFSAWAARGVRLREARVAEDLRRAGDEQAEFTAALLAFLVREPSASDAATSSEDRARSVLRWHLAALFGGLEVEKAEVSDMAAAGASSVEVSLACRGERRARWLRAEPARLCWSKLPVGWIIKLGLAERLERARDVLKRPLAGESPSAPGAAP
jgi:hypothetical protein